MICSIDPLQFEEICLDVSLLMLDGKFLNSDARCSPVLVSRTLAEMVRIYKSCNNSIQYK